MNWLLGKDRYNPLIRPAVNRTERVTVKLQVSLAQLISVVRHQTVVSTVKMCIYLCMLCWIRMCARDTKKETEKGRVK